MAASAVASTEAWAERGCSVRYVVTEIEGYPLKPHGSRLPSLSCHVIDTMWNHRLVATFRSEDRKGIPRWRGRSRTRELAAERAALLNRVDEQQAA